MDRIDTFPAETEKPIVAAAETRFRIITVVIYGEAAEKTIKALAERVRDDLTALREISQVETAGVRRYGLSFSQVADAVRGSSLDLPGGEVKTAGGEILLRTKGQKYRGAEFEDIAVLTRGDGTQLRLAGSPT